MRKTKTATIRILAALLIMAMFLSGSVAAAGEKVLTATKVEGDAGSKVVLTVKAENLKGSEGGQFTLTFDQNLVKPISIEPGDLILSAGNDLHMANLEYAPGKLIFMWVTASAETIDSGAICLITFDLLKEGTTVVGFDEVIVVDENGEIPKSVAGQIKIGPAGSTQGTTTDPDQETDSDETDPALIEEGADEEVIGEENGEEDEKIVADRVAVNPLLIIVPLIIIAALAGVYYLTIKSRKKTASKK